MKTQSPPQILWSLFKTTRLYARIDNATQPLRDRVRAHVAEVRAAQLDFNEKLDRAADAVGIVNVERLMAGKDIVEQTDVWAPLRARQAAAVAAFNARPVAKPCKPFPGSAHEAQVKFNQAAEAYVAKYGIVAFEEAMKPEPTPVPVSDPEPPRRPQGKHYRY
ncbi:MAG: hypothetical protein KKA05_04815 [Alphaproteobacteria bacterium]|nr:hypothetical protein [Alphaproteobacteria bacterium]